MTRRNKSANTMPPIENLDYKILRVMQHGKTVFFDMCLNGVYVYGLTVVSGKNGDFISWPSRKGKDDKYYSYAYAKFTDAQQDDILDAVFAKLDE